MRGLASGVCSTVPDTVGAFGNLEGAEKGLKEESEMASSRREGHFACEQLPVAEDDGPRVRCGHESCHAPPQGDTARSSRHG